MFTYPYGFMKVAAGSSLLTGLVSWWSLEEASGNSVDAHGSNNLSNAGGTPSSATGKISNALQLVAADDEWLNVAAGHGLQGTARDYTMCCWCYLDTSPTWAGLMSVQSGSGNTVTDYMLVLNSARFKFYVPEGATWQIVTANTFGAPSTATWYFVMASYTASGGTLSISVNNGTADTLGGVTSPNTTNTAFNLGNYPQVGRWDGRIDEAAFWSRLLTSDEKAELYNSGSGIAYPG